MSGKPGYLIVAPWEVTEQGGVNGVIRHLIREMDKERKYKPVLLESDSTYAGPYYKSWSGTPTFRMHVRAPFESDGGFRMIRRLAAFLLTLPVTMYRIRDILSSYRVEAINVHYPSINSIVFVVLKKLNLFNGKLILSFHNSDAMENLKLTGASRLVYEMILKNSDVIVAVSGELKEAIIGDVPEIASKTEVIHNGVDLHRFKRAELDGDCVPRDDHEKTIICVAALEFRKGIDVLLRSFVQVRSVCSSVKLLVVGESGGDDDSLFKLAERLEVTPHVEWRRGASASEVAQLMMHADIFVLPSRDEGFSLALLEAGAAELPVVATRVGGAPELIIDGENGLLVDPDDPGALAVALLKVLNDPTLAQIGTKLRKTVSDRFTWDVMYRGYERLAR